MLTPEELEKLSGAESLFARLYGYTPKMMGQIEGDKLAYCKSIYEKHGGERTNLAYGYINKG